MIIEEVFYVTGRGVVVTVKSDGEVKTGDWYELSANDTYHSRRVQIKGVEHFLVPGSTDKGESIGLLLPGMIKKESVDPGQELTRVVLPDQGSQKRVCAVDALIISPSHNDIVLLHRNHEPFKDSWVLPGGFVDPGETCEQAVVREAKEETGLDVRIVGLVGVYSAPERDPRQNISIVYLCDLEGQGHFSSEDEGTCHWFSLGSIAAVGNMAHIGFDHLQIIRDASDKGMLPLLK